MSVAAPRLRRVVRVDRQRCAGCGVCLDACAKHALTFSCDRARLVDPRLCDGDGVCVSLCSQEALALVDLEVPEFDGDAVRARLEKRARLRALGADLG